MLEGVQGWRGGRIVEVRGRADEEPRQLGRDLQGGRYPFSERLQHLKDQSNSPGSGPALRRGGCPAVPLGLLGCRVEVPSPVDVLEGPAAGRDIVARGYVRWSSKSLSVQAVLSLPSVI